MRPDRQQVARNRLRTRPTAPPERFLPLSKWSPLLRRLLQWHSNSRRRPPQWNCLAAPAPGRPGLGAAFKLHTIRAQLERGSDFAVAACLVEPCTSCSSAGVIQQLLAFRVMNLNCLSVRALQVAARRCQCAHSAAAQPARRWRQEPGPAAEPGAGLRLRARPAGRRCWARLSRRMRSEGRRPEAAAAAAAGAAAVRVAACAG